MDLRNFRGVWEIFGRVEKYSRGPPSLLRNFRGGLRNFGKGYEIFGGGVRNFRGGGEKFLGGGVGGEISGVLRFFREGLGFFLEG